MSSEAVKCRAEQCPVTIRMLVYPKTQRRAPIEANAHTDGNILVDLDHGTYTILRDEELKQAREAGMSLHFNHFARCEFRGQFSKPASETPAVVKEHQ